MGRVAKDMERYRMLLKCIRWLLSIEIQLLDKQYSEYATRRRRRTERIGELAELCELCSELIRADRLGQAAHEEAQLRQRCLRVDRARTPPAQMHSRECRRITRAQTHHARTH